VIKLKTKLKVLDLFSGIGGFSLGLHSTDIFDTVKFVEFDEFCQKVLKKNFPNIPIEGDIKNVKGKEFEADIIVGGFPCQPFSVAGKQKGRDDNRYLWPEMFRLIKEIKPEFVIGENVQGLVNLQNGMVLRQVQDDLEGEGFEVQCFLIPASGIGAWHQRFRVWIVGHSKHNGLLAAEKRSRDKKINGGTQEGQDQTIELERTSGSRNDEDVSNTISELSDGCSSTTGDSEAELIRLECNEGWHWNQVRSEVERCSEQSKSTNQTWWQIESDLCGVPNGISRELDKDRASRIKSLGNAIVPQMARIFGLAIKKVLSDSDCNGQG
jgi:DNA (cytosine-5)-methyltransferase 1